MPVKVSEFLSASFVGFTGSKGIQGTQGNIGFTGSIGADGTVAGVSSTAPSPATAGQIWYDVDDGTISVYSGSEWVVTSGPQGTMGTVGYTGSLGYTGSRGIAGYSGSSGDTGTVAVTSSTPPVLPVEGQIWFDPSDATISVYFTDADSSQWVTASGPTGFAGYTGSSGFVGSQGIIGSVGYTGSGGIDGVTGTVTDTSETAPADPVNGQMWFDPNDATISVYYTDADSSQWITTSGSPGPLGYTGSVGFVGSQGIIGSVGYTGSSGTDGVTGTLTDTSEAAPTTPVNGQMWFDPNDATISVYYTDADSSQWIATSGSPGPLGYTGSVGFVGSQGVIGFTGSQGVIGYTGSQGIAGEYAGQGYTGSSGVTNRTVMLPNATSLTVDIDITDLAYQVNTQAAGTLTINAPTGTPADGQKFILRINSTNIQTFSFDPVTSIFVGSVDIILPTASTGSGKTDYLGFVYYNSATPKWHLIAKSFGS